MAFSHIFPRLPSLWRDREGDFSRPKIVWGEISDRSKFAYDYEGKYVPEATTFLMTGSDLPYLLCVLNNPASEWFFSKLGTTTGVGTVRWKKFTIEQLPIPSINDRVKGQICSLVERLSAKSIIYDDFIKATNNVIYKALNLTGDEVDFVEAFAH